MKKFGFTLAEVLITLGIIGVVAALTAPALVMQSRDQANAARLSVVVSNLENAFTTALSTDNVPSLYQTNIWVNGFPNGVLNRAAFIGNMKNVINVTDWRDMSVANYYNSGGATGMHMMTQDGGVNAAVAALPVGPGDFDDGSNILFETKQGALVVMRPYTVAMGDGSDQRIANMANHRTQVTNAGGGLQESAASVMIDVNGTQAPNVWGRDIYFFILGSNGILYPYGGLDVSAYVSLVSTSTWNQANNWCQCQDGGFITGGGRGCAGRVISEGYRINY